MSSPITLITGASGGLGAAVTQAFLAAGHSVVGVSRSIAEGDFAHPRLVVAAAELAQAAGARLAVDVTLARFKRLDNLVHLVGAWTGGQPVADTPAEAFARMWEVNMLSTVNILQAAMPALRASGHGRIVAVGSRNALEPAANNGAYNAAKAAVVALIRTVAREEAAHGITANTVLPGTMDTPGNRRAMPDADPAQWVPVASVASLILWLTTEAGGSVNGAATPIYGRD